MSSVRSLLGVCRWQPGLENLARIWGKRMVEMAKVDLPVPSCQKKKKKWTRQIKRDAKPMLLGPMYEVSSIKNANPSIKFEGIKLQKCLACKKGINVVV